MSAGRRLASALAAAAVILSPALVAVGPATAAPERTDRTPDVALDTGLDTGLLTRVRPPVLTSPPVSARASSGRAYPRPLFAFWGAKYNRIDGGTWGKVSGSRGRIGKHYVVARAPAHVVPAGVVSQTVDYRLKTKRITRGPRKARRSVASKPVTVTFDNQAMYTGDQARFYAPPTCAPTRASTSTPPTSPATAAASSAGSTASRSIPPTWRPASTSPRSPSSAPPSTSART